MENEVVEFKALITYEQYYNEDTSWGVFGFSTKDEIPFSLLSDSLPFKDEFHDEPKKLEKFSRIVGKVQHLCIGAEYQVSARIAYSDKYKAYQYEPIYAVAITPKNEEAQRIFLETLTSTRIVNNLLNAYPNIVNDVIDGTIDTIDYNLVNGIGEFTWNIIKEKIINNYIISDIIVMLQPLGITYKMIKKLIEEEPNPTLLKQQLQDNPYIMTKIHGLGFKRIDALALKLKPELLISIHRLVAYVYYYFTELGEDEGYTWVSFDRLKDNVSNNVPECISLFNDMLQMNDFIYYDKDSDRIGLKKFRDIEVEIFNILYSKSLYVNTKISFTDEEIVKAIKQAEEEQGYTYSEEQNEVITNTLKQNISIITGCAGTGKTSISRAIFIAYQNKHYSMALSALSAKASKRITEATGFPAVTIHRTLGCTGFNKFAFNKDCKMITDLAFMDEASMTNARLFYDWLVSIKDDTRIILCGDHKQLPPIGYGNVFSDLIEYTEILNVNILSKPMRQALESGILSDANLIRENINPLTKIEPKIITGNLQDMYYIFRENRDNLQSIAINTYLKSIETDGLDEVIIVTPRKEDCLNSSREINKIIQDKLLGHEKLFIDKGDMKFYKGAKVIQRVNNYEKKIFNGDIGYITDIYTKTVGKLEKQFCQITFNDCSTGNQILEYEKNELDQIDFAYALTVHLCQGSGYKTVIGIIDMTHYKLLDSTMLYTLLTRAKKRCCLLAEPNAFFQCLRTSHNQRCTWLKELKNEKIFENNFKKPIDIHF